MGLYLDRRAIRGWRVSRDFVQYIEWGDLLIILLMILTAPVTVPAYAFFWFVGLCSEKREERREGIRTVKD